MAVEVGKPGPIICDPNNTSCEEEKISCNADEAEAPRSNNWVEYVACALFPFECYYEAYIARKNAKTGAAAGGTTKQMADAVANGAAMGAAPPPIGTPHRIEPKADPAAALKLAQQILDRDPAVPYHFADSLHGDRERLRVIGDILRNAEREMAAELYDDANYADTIQRLLNHPDALKK